MKFEICQMYFLLSFYERYEMNTSEFATVIQVIFLIKKGHYKEMCDLKATQNYTDGPVDVLIYFVVYFFLISFFLY